MHNKVSEILLTTFSLLGIVAITGVSSFVVLNMSPIPLIEEKSSIGPNVAGISTGLNTLTFINTAAENDNYKTQLLSKDNRNTYISSFDRSEKGEVIDKFIRVNNNTEFTDSFQIESVLPKNLINLIDIEISDNLDLIKLEHRKPKRITLKPNSYRDFRIVFNFNTNINYDFEILFNIIN